MEASPSSYPEHGKHDVTVSDLRLALAQMVRALGEGGEFSLLEMLGLFYVWVRVGTDIAQASAGLPDTRAEAGG